MSADSEHVDTLLALAVVFGETAEDRDGGARQGPEGRGHAVALEALSALDPSTRQAVERRTDWYTRLTRRKQLDWLTHTLSLARAGATPAQLDEHVHPSHVVEALSDEPPRVRDLVMRHLPPALVASVAAGLGVEPPDVREASGGGAAVPAPETVAVLRRVFLSQFVTAGELSRITPLELLSGAELARLVRLLGVRETAVACRGIEAVEAVASFLRRFASEDAQAIAAHIASLTDLGPARVRFAERVVREALLAERDAGAMLDRVGLCLLAIALSGRENRARLRYAAQKLPADAARWLEEMSRAGVDPLAGESAEERREALRSIARATEAVAAGLRRSRHATRRGLDDAPSKSLDRVSEL